MKPPFRADVVGSLLRPEVLKAARADFDAGRIDAGALARVEDECIRGAVARQESTGLAAVTDGEYRRGWWNHDFIGRLDGIDLVVDAKSPRFVGSNEARLTPHVVGKVRRSRPLMVEHFAFLRSVAKATPKFCMPAPSVLYHRGGRGAISREVYPDLAKLWEDVGRAYREEIRDLAAAGCTYLQIDDTSHSFLCDPKFRDACRARGDDPDRLPGMFADALNLCIADRPEGMTVVMHTCRGNWKSTWMAEGSYEPVADIVFNRTRVDGYFLEYDTDRAGGFEPLRLLPRGKRVVLGLVSTKTPALEDKSVLARRIDAASKFVPLEDLSVSPQCGFASSHHGNALSEDDQWRKLDLVVSLAREVWGSVS